MDDPPGLCDALREGRDLVTSVPPDKFEAAAFVDSGHRRPGHSYVGAGGFLTDAAGADAEFFGIFAAGGEPDGSAAAADAGAGVGGAGGCRYPSGCLAGSDTGVFVGLSNRDYAELQHADLRTVDADIGAGGGSGQHGEPGLVRVGSAWPEHGDRHGVFLGAGRAA
ncbi:MAG: hypothetical protein HOV84_10950 [Streptomyces sp.]|nr:hypothetical protein [Streptomyces sp.]